MPRSAASGARLFGRAEWTGPVALFLLLLAIDIGLKGGRFSMFDLSTLCSNVLPLALISLGQFLVILTRGIDLSLGPIMSVSSCLLAVLTPFGTLPALVAALASGLVAGALNGALVAGLGLRPVIVTLATMSVWDGVALLVLPTPGGVVPPGLQMVLTAGRLVLPVPVLLLIAAALSGVWLTSTRVGLHLRAIGGDPQAAATSGVALRGVTLFAYVIGAVFAALGGIYLAISTSAGSPIIGDGFILSSIAAVVLGGVPLTGGRGSAIGVVMGALMLTIIGSLLYFANLSDFYQSLINGLILIAVVLVGNLRRLAFRRAAP